MKTILDLPGWLLGWLVDSGVGTLILRSAGVLVVVGVIWFLAYGLVKKLTLRIALDLAGIVLGGASGFAAISAIWFGAWWWFAPPAIAVLLGAVIRIEDGIPKGSV